MILSQPEFLKQMKSLKQMIAAQTPIIVNMSLLHYFQYILRNGCHHMKPERVILHGPPLSSLFFTPY